ncbi:hydroxypyruvate isomerase [Halopseudomonas xinjiangensis]|uniref:Hydroxypyruvate isomerase n=1 Tax=Halopseudomonas xinjiangensis TaxID=487184 RepID=A0A1H1MMT3_9GAMM|nr:TIM barrel protein [Halopseudomonas xinjiangensis]SDR87922.1 hydroxypyruvate isomerase [Halopseudomonas xinjiangensis]
MSWLLAANLSLLFTEQPLPGRIAAAAGAGFDGVEIQFPYEIEPQHLTRLLADSAMPLALINLPAGDMMTGGPGLASVPARASEFHQALQAALRYAERVRPQRVNILPGRLAEGIEPEAAIDTLVDNLQIACSAFESLGIGVTFEAINRHDMPGFLIATPAEQRQVIERVAHANLSAQLDFYHMARMDIPPAQAIRELVGSIGHVQFADVPGRGMPGSGGLDFAAAFRALDEAGYQGWLAAEYRAAGMTSSDLGWIEHWRAQHWIRTPACNE